MHINTVLYVQLPLVAALLIGGAAAKLVQLARTGAVGSGFGPALLLPVRLRGPVAAGICFLELGLGVGLILTAGQLGAGRPAVVVRLATGLLFIAAICALIELRARHPDASCGCFGDFSIAPVSVRSTLRSALLAAASLATIRLPPINLHNPQPVARLVVVGILELLLVAALSPEIGEALIRLGYAEPCELHDVPTDKTVAALRRSKAWRRNSALIASDTPVDVWREMCWRYLVYPSSYADGQAEIVFAVSLRQRRPLIMYSLVHAATGQALPTPVKSTDGKARRSPALPLPAEAALVPAPVQRDAERPGMPFSTHL